MIAMRSPWASEQHNPLHLDGLACIEFAAPTPEGLDALGRLFASLGFSRTHRHTAKNVEYWRQGEVRFVVDREPGSLAGAFARQHGPSIPAIALRTDDAERAVREAVRRGAKEVAGDLAFGGAPAIAGIGGSRIYFADGRGGRDERFIEPDPSPLMVAPRGLCAIDHLTNNVPRGTLEDWRRFYVEVLGFTDVRSFDIRGRSTGLTSHALRSPCGKFCLPLNEGSDDRSQIEEYLREYDGPGIQHVALLSDDLLASLDGLSGVSMLDIDPDYYVSVFDRVPHVSEDRQAIQRAQVLVDGDDEGYLLQIFTQKVIGPIFFELIQRHDHDSFGEGNFSALFRSIERDQERRGVI